MSVTINANTEKNELVIAVSGHFDFRLVREFRHAYNAMSEPASVIVDLKHTNYIDSSGLGILVYLRKHFNCRKENIHLINCNKEIQKTFQMARFNKMFMIS